MRKLFYLLTIFALFLSLSTSIALAANDGMPDIQNPFDKLQVKIPGMDKLTDARACADDPSKICFPWLGEYIVSIYKYAISIVGILATIVMMVGGFMWLLAGGNPSKISEAKSWISASLTGLIIALSSYLILYQINPNLVKFDALKVQLVKPISPEEIKTIKLSVPCNVENLVSNNTIKYDNLTSYGTKLPPACSNYNFVYTNNVDGKILGAIAAQESNCNPNSKSNAGACGMMQILPSTAKSMCGSVSSLKINNTDPDSVICSKLINDPQGSIECAATYIRNNISKHNWNTKDIFAGYNGGYSTSNSNGKKGPLAASSDCKGVRAYECCTNPGELMETQNYVYSALQFYNYQKSTQ